MIAGAAVLLIANIAACWGAFAIIKRIRTNTLHVDILAFLLVRLGLLSMAILMAGLTGGLSSWGLGFLAISGIGFLLFLDGKPNLTTHHLRVIPKWFWVVGGIILFRLLLQVWFFSPHLGDTVSYHLPKIAEWIRMGGFTSELGPDSHASLPAGFELIETWWVVFLKHDVLIEMAGLEFLVLGAAATYSLARQASLAGRWAVLAALCYTLTPAIQVQATSCLNDAPVGALVLTTFAFVLARAPYALVVLCLGLGVGVKATYAFALPGVLLLGFFVRKQPRVGSMTLRYAVAIGLAAVITGGVWYVRNTVWFGNPIHPIGMTGFHDEDGNEQIQLGPSASSLLTNVSSLAEDRVYDRDRPYGPLLTRIAGWGGIGFACGAVSLLLVLRTDPSFRLLVASFLVSLLFVFLLVRHDDWYLRHVLFFPAILCIAATRAAMLFRPVFVLTTIALVCQFGATSLTASIRFNTANMLAKQGWHERSAARLFEAEPPEGRIACLATDGGTPYFLYGPAFSNEVIYVRPRSTEELMLILTERKIFTLYAAPTGAVYEKILIEAVGKGLLEPISGLFYRRPVDAIDGS